MSIEVVLTGKLKDPDGYRELGAEMCKVASDEEGTLRYDWLVSPEGAFRNVDVYADSAAFLEHFGAAQAAGYLERYMGLVEVERVDVSGDVSPEARAALSQFGANFLDQVASISA
ncbi:MAG TPA: antibiotic biosynthesis monooxygenase [Actinomycetota bacterium]